MQKTLWAYWHQGEENAPFLVRECLASWRRLNPDWTLEVLDRDTAAEWVDLTRFQTRDDIGLQAFTDILRMALLLRFGGVWVDATLYCVRPLDDWLYQHAWDEFFGFASRKPDRLITTWFLYGTSGSRLLNAWYEEIIRYWESHRFARGGYGTKQILRKLTSLRKRRLVSNDIWFSRFVTHVVRAYPYPVNMYLFERALSRAPALEQTWFRHDHLYDAPAEHLQHHFGINNPSTDETVRFLKENPTPVHKLNWRQDKGKAISGSNLELLIDMFSGRNRTRHVQ